MNVELLRKAVSLPVYMPDWYAVLECGTVGCIAGNIILSCGDVDLTQRFMEGSLSAWEIRSRALAKAELPSEDIFYTSDWPSDLRKEYHILADSFPFLDRTEGHLKPEMQALLHRVVEDYIQTNGWQEK